MNLTAIFHDIASSPTLQAIGITAMILYFGFLLLHNLTPDSPFRPYAIQSLALVVILPIILTFALANKFPLEALTGLLGTIVGFFFGGAQGARSGRGQPLGTGRSASQRGTGDNAG
jgi:hypothetical protein